MVASPVALESVGQISIVVKDVERARNFYRDTLGLKFLFEFPGVAFFNDSEENTVALMSEVAK